MRFLIDENLPALVGSVFEERGYEVEVVLDQSALRGESDEVIFDYAVNRGAILVTRDLDFTNPLRFSIKSMRGVIIIRFPNEVSISILCDELRRLISKLTIEDFKQLIIIEPGSLRMRSLS